VNSRRILITGVSTYWGGRLAQALEQNPDVEAIVGVDSEDPTRELARTEYVRVGTQHALLRRIVDAAEIDTVVDTRLIVNSAAGPPSRVHETNVIGTMNILAACSGRESSVRKLVFKSSGHFYGSEQDDPAFFTEEMGRPHPPRTPLERDIVEAEAAVADYAEKHPHTSVTVLRFANVLGPDVRTPHTDMLSLPVVPMILGFDPRYQFVHEDDVVHALAHALEQDLPGVFNVAADGVLALSEVAGLLRKPYAPILPPWGTGLATGVLRRLGIRIAPEMQNQLRFGRGLDNRRFKATGFEYRYTTREAVLRFAEHLRLGPLMRAEGEPYRYEREVEEFLRWSPHVRRGELGRGSPLSGRQIMELRELLAAAEAGDVALEGQGATEAATAGGMPSGGRVARRRPRDPAPEAGDGADRRAGSDPGAVPAPSPVEDYDDLDAQEIVSLLGSLERDDLEALREHERRSRARSDVLAAIEAALEREGAGREA
jgi:UDP-glucose 4-epimerase